ncbi:RNA polymerase subunit RPABC4/transcription elongation factor Spt4 [Desulfitispora alkaliphila]
MHGKYKCERCGGIMPTHKIICGKKNEEICPVCASKQGE